MMVVCENFLYCFQISAKNQNIAIGYDCRIRKTIFRTNRSTESLVSHLYRFSEYGRRAAEH